MKPLTACLAAWILALVPVLSSPAGAQSHPVVVELFTSQGCSSCPPADKLMHKLAQRDDVIPLALHVDYWDYIGWKDLFAQPGYTKRQKAYAHAGGRKMVYTPQMIINGQQDVVGAHAMEVADLIMLHKAATPVVALQVQRAGSDLLVRAEPLAEVTGPLVVQLVRYTPLNRVDITRGENAGRVLDYANVVDDWKVVGSWDGQGPMDLTLSIDGDRPAVVLIQQQTYGPIIAAARVGQ